MAIAKLSGLIKDSMIRGGIITALSASALVYSVSILTGLPVRVEFIIIVFLLSSVVYFSNFLGEMKSDFVDKPEEYRLLKKQNLLLCSIIFVLIVSCLAISWAYGNKWSIIFVLFFIVFGFLYTFKIKSFTKQVAGFKDIYVALCWNLVIPFFLLFHNYHMSWKIFFLMVLVFSRDLMNASYCDLKDLDLDKKQGLLTFANYLGVRKFFVFLTILNVFSVLMVVLGILMGILPSVSLAIIISVGLVSLLIDISKHTASYSTLNVDVEYLLWFLLLNAFLL